MFEISASGSLGNDRAVSDSFASLIGLTSRYMLPFVIPVYQEIALLDTVLLHL